MELDKSSSTVQNNNIPAETDQTSPSSVLSGGHRFCIGILAQIPAMAKTALCALGIFKDFCVNLLDPKSKPEAAKTLNQEQSPSAAKVEARANRQLVKGANKQKMQENMRLAKSHFNKQTPKELQKNVNVAMDKVKHNNIPQNNHDRMQNRPMPAARNRQTPPQEVQAPAVPQQRPQIRVVPKQPKENTPGHIRVLPKPEENNPGHIRVIRKPPQQTPPAKIRVIRNQKIADIENKKVVNVAKVQQKPIELENSQLPPVGLPNSRDQQRCYINVVLQLIIHTPALKNEVGKDPEFSAFMHAYSVAQQNNNKNFVSQLPPKLMQRLRELTRLPLPDGRDGGYPKEVLLGLIQGAKENGVQRKINGLIKNEAILTPNWFNKDDTSINSLEEALNLDIQNDGIQDLGSNFVVNQNNTNLEKTDTDLRSLNIKDKQGNPVVYECSFCIYNTGSHWIALSKVGDKWYKIDDTNVTHVEEEDVKDILKKGNAILNYQKKHS